MKLVVTSLIISALVLVQGQMPQRVNDPRMEYQVGFRPFGSDLPCYALINETLAKNEDDVIIERILMNIDEPGNSFNSNANTNRLDNMAARICGQMQNTVGYLRNTCQQNTNNVDSTSQAKLRALGALREYLCLNNAVNLKEMISANGGQCVRRIRDSAEANCNVPTQPSGSFNSGSFNSGSSNSGSSSNFQGGAGGNSFNSGRMGPRSLTSMIIAAPNYNSDTCRTINDAANCVSDKYNRAVEICYPQFTMHMSRIISSLVQNTCGGSVASFPNGNNNFNNNNFNNNNNWNNNNNQNPPSFNVNSNSNSFPPNNNNVGSTGNNFGSSSNSFPQTADSGFRTTTWAPRPVWMTSTRRPGNSATLQTVSAILLSVAILPCLLI